MQLACQRGWTELAHPDQWPVPWAVRAAVVAALAVVRGMTMRRVNLGEATGMEVAVAER